MRVYRTLANRRGLGPLFMIAALTLLLAIACAPKSTPTPASQPRATNTPAASAPTGTFQNGGPRLALDRTSQDFGNVPVDKEFTATFRLTNTGDAPLVITRMVNKALEGC